MVGLTAGRNLVPTAALKAAIEIERRDKDNRFTPVVLGQKLPLKSCYYFAALSLAASSSSDKNRLLGMVCEKFQAPFAEFSETHQGPNEPGCTNSKDFSHGMDYGGSMQQVNYAHTVECACDDEIDRTSFTTRTDSSPSLGKPVRSSVPGRLLRDVVHGVFSIFSGTSGRPTGWATGRSPIDVRAFLARLTGCFLDGRHSRQSWFGV